MSRWSRSPTSTATGGAISLSPSRSAARRSARARRSISIFRAVPGENLDSGSEKLASKGVDGTRGGRCCARGQRRVLAWGSRHGAAARHGLLGAGNLDRGGGAVGALDRRSRRRAGRGAFSRDGGGRATDSCFWCVRRASRTGHAGSCASDSSPSRASICWRRASAAGSTRWRRSALRLHGGGSGIELVAGGPGRAARWARWPRSRRGLVDGAVPLVERPLFEDAGFDPRRSIPGGCAAGIERRFAAVEPGHLRFWDSTGVWAPEVPLPLAVVRTATGLRLSSPPVAAMRSAAGNLYLAGPETLGSTRLRCFQIALLSPAQPAPKRLRRSSSGRRFPVRRRWSRAGRSRSTACRCWSCAPRPPTRSTSSSASACAC